jgi:signal transduction histidine kinase
MARLLQDLTSPRTYTRIVYLLLALPLGIAEFTFLATAIPFGVGTAITLLGIPVLIFTMYAVRWIATGERWLIEQLVGVRIAPPYRPVSGNWWSQLRDRLADPATWKDLVYLLLQLPLGIAAFTVTVVVLSVGIGGLTAPIWFWAANDTDGFPSNTVESFTLVPAGAMVLLLGIPALSALGRLYGAFATLLLGSNEDPEVTAEMSDLRDARARVIAAADAERRRLERDLHDGAQQRLVSLALTLRMAEKRAADGDEKAAELVRQASEEAGMALAELRDLARGLHPAILTNRGLAAALEDLAGRATVPVELAAVPARRLPEPVEAAAYFVVSECLANIGKHAQATQATVSATEEDGALVVEVADDGIGGIAGDGGSGLTGLEDRVGALEGTLSIRSPRGEGTRVTARIPLAGAVIAAAAEQQETRTPPVYTDGDAAGLVARRRRNFLLRAAAAGLVASVVVLIWALTSWGETFWPAWPLLGIGWVVAMDAWLSLARRPVRAAEVTGWPDPAAGARAVARRRRLVVEVGAMGVLNAGLIGVWLLAGAGYFWPIWPLLGTAIAFGVKAIVAAARQPAERPLGAQ